MSRHDKIGAAVLGLLLFSGLFYFIYTTMKNPLPAEFGDEESGVVTATLDLAQAAKHRAGMGFFRDRRPELYGRICRDE